MIQETFVGYSGRVWTAIYAGLAYYQTQLATASVSGTPGAVYAISQTMFNSLVNGVDAINAYSISSAWLTQTSQLSDVAALPISGVPSADQLIFNNRLSAYTTGTIALAALVPQPPFLAPSISLPNGMPIVPYPGLLEFFESFSYETPPSGLTPANFTANASGIVTAFNTVAGALQSYQGVSPTNIYDSVVLEATAASGAAYIIGSLTAGPLASDIVTTNAWNQLVTLPTMTMVADTINDSPGNQISQQSACIRNAMLTIAQSIAQLLISLNTPITTQVNQTTLLNGESLMDVAARCLGNFELWTEIAALNNLMPPYVAMIGSSGVAAYGTNILLPTPGVSQAAAGATVSYNTNFLGTDLYVGPINGDMPTWTGDFQTITGLTNLAWALGRRLQTPINSLIYHQTYGSRIPPEVGMVLDNATAGQINAYGTSALLSDPRVQSVINAISTLLPSSQGIQFTGTVQPKGQGSTPTVVNQVIST